MRFAVFTASLPDWTPQEAVWQLSAQGWDGIEWRVVDQQLPADGSVGFWQGNRCTWPLSSFLDDVPQIAEITSAAGLAMPALGAYARCDDLAAVEKLMHGAARLGVRQMRVPVGAAGPEGYPATFEQRRKEYREVERLAKQYDVKALVELHHQTLTASASSAVRFLDGFDPDYVGVIHDIGNMLREGYEHDLWSLQILGPYLAHVHVKNAVPVAQEAEAPRRTDWVWDWAPMRHGVANLPALFEALAKVGYDRWVSVEDFSSDRALNERVADNLAYLHELVRS